MEKQGGQGLSYEERFFAGDFAELAKDLQTALATADGQEEDAATGYSLSLLLVAILRQLDATVDTRQRLTHVRDRLPRPSDDLWLALGHLAADGGDREGARKFFRLVAEHTALPVISATACLALADLELMVGNFNAAEQIFRDLHDLAETLPAHLALSLQLLGARCLAQRLESLATARQMALAVFGQARARDWLSFEVRALQILMLISLVENRTDRFAGEQAMLTQLLALQPMPRLARLSEDILPPAIAPAPVPIHLDHEQRRIAFGHEWTAFHDRPILFHFLAFLYGRSEFIAKRVLSEHLWPFEKYKPRLHDPRLFDIARRVRGILAATAAKDLVLLSGRLGYLLAWRSDATAPTTAKPSANHANQ